MPSWRRRLPEHLVEPLPEPRGVVAGERLAERGPRDQNVVPAGRYAADPLAPAFAQPPLHAVPLHRRARALRHGDPEPGLAVVVAREPVEDEEARRDRAAVPVDGVEVPSSVRDGGGAAPRVCGQPLPALRPAPLQDGLARTRGHARAEAVLALAAANVWLVGPLHRGSERMKKAAPEIAEARGAPV